MPLTDVEVKKIIEEARSYKLPDWLQTGFKRARQNLQVHTKGLLFKKIDTLFPNEDPASKQHCVDSYEPITKGSIWKGITNLQRIIVNSSFSLSASESTIAKLEDTTYEGKNFFTWFVEKWINNVVAEDPNSLIAFYPQEYIDKYGGQQIRFVKTEHIRKISDEMIVFISEEESRVDYELKDVESLQEYFKDPNLDGKLNTRIGTVKTYNSVVAPTVKHPVYHVFSKDYILRFTEKELGKGEYTFSVFELNNKFKMLYAYRASSPEIYKGLNESFVSPFIPFGNLTLLQHRNHRAVDLMFSYPRLSEIETPCLDYDCKPGAPDGNPCKSCNGSGFVTVQSPYKVYKRKTDTGATDVELQKALLAADPVKFHTPDTGILEYSKKSWKEYLSLAEESIFIQQRPTTGNIESWKAKQIDREAEYTWVGKVCNALYNDMRTAIELIEYSSGVSEVAVKLDEPTSFAIVTESEAFEALNYVIGSDAPVMVKAQQVDNFISKYVNKNSPFVKAMKVLKIIDPLLYYSAKDAQTFSSNSVIKPQAWAVHIYAYPLLMQMYQTDATILELPVLKIVEKLKEKLEGVLPEPEKTFKQNVFDEV